MNLIRLNIFLIILTLTVGCGSEDTPDSLLTVNTSTPNAFLKYPNPQASLAPGEYKIVAATATAGETGNFSITVTHDNGTTQSFTGQWIDNGAPNNGSGGTDQTSSDNPRFTVSLQSAGGIIISISSNVDSFLYLLDANDNIVAQDDNSGSNNNALINIAQSAIDNTAWAEAYYSAIDPANERDTLSKWKLRTGFLDPGDDINAPVNEDIHVIFRDTKDLGYGRNMYLRTNDRCVYIYVENFRVDVIEGLPYTTLNLTAAIENDRIHHFGTNAIEYSDIDGNCDGSKPLFNKFFTFKAYPENPSTDETLLLKVDLDGRGEKAMPGPCIVCHGGTAKPLLSDGSFPSTALPGSTSLDIANRVGDTKAKLQPLEVDSFEYSNVSPWTKAELEPKLKQMNEIVFSTYPTGSRNPDPAAIGEWTGDFLQEVVQGWYGGSGFPNSLFDATYIPSGWQYDPNDNNPPVEAEELFLQVVKPYCLACHSKQGSALGSDENANGEGKDVNFSSYEKFISYADTIEEYVYARGIMPLSLLTYDKFWDSDAPEILATHLPGFSHANSDGSINQPGKPVAHAGLDRTTTSPTKLSAASSLFADSFTWSIIDSPTGSVASLDNNNSMTPILTADSNGTYVLQLVARNGSQQSKPDQITITIDNALTPAPEDITFDTHIKPILQTDCVQCHQDAGGEPGVPVYYTDSTSLYSDVIQRVNFSYPELSKLLLKPTGYHHFGGIRGDGIGTRPELNNFNLSGDKTDYNLFVNWILEGAREN